MTTRLPVAGKSVWMLVRVWDGGDFYSLTIVEEAGMAQKVESTAAELKKLLDERGVVVLRNILFDTGKAIIRPESEPTLAAVGELLKNDSALRLEIQGHTDATGTKEANLKLSQERAGAVRDYLVKTFGIAGDRLTAVGFGGTKPVADNSTEEGRAQNRRVELVKR